MKGQEDSFSSGDCESSQSNNYSKWGTSNRKYSRITPQVKDKLIFLIVRNNMSIKQAAQYLKINYSSAKFIFSQYRDKNQQCDQPTKDKTLQFRTRKLEDNEDDGIEVKFTVGGKYEGQTSKTLTASQIYDNRLTQGFSNDS